MDTIDLERAFIYVIYDLLNITDSIQACKKKFSRLANITSVDNKNTYYEIVNYLTSNNLFAVRLESMISPDSCFSRLELDFEYPNLVSTDICAENEYFNVKLPSLCFQPKNKTAPADTPYYSHYDPTESNIAGIICCLVLIIPSTGWYCYCRYKLYRYKSQRRRAIRWQRMMMSRIAAGAGAEAGSSETLAGTSTAKVKHGGEVSRAKEEKSAVSGWSGAEMTRDKVPGKKI